MDSLVIQASLACTFFSCAFALAYYFKQLERPNWTLPIAFKKSIGSSLPVFQALTSGTSGLLKVDQIPWTTKPRFQFPCTLTLCGSKSNSAFVVQLPPIVPPGSPLEDSTNTYYLSTQQHFRTNYFNDYPVATVLEIPETTPKNVVFLLDAAGPYGLGLRPLIQQDNQSLDMTSLWDYVGQTRLDPLPSLNVTGDYPHTFVLVNKAGHSMYFGKQAFEVDEPMSANDYWKILPGAWVLLYPSQPYWASITSDGTKRYWNALTLPPNLQNHTDAAHIAEIQMYSILRPQ